MCDRRVFRDDYVRLRRGAAVSTLRESADASLLSVLSLRWQAFRLLRVTRTRTRTGAAPAPASEAPVESDADSDEWEETASFSDARPPVGAACAPDDEDPLAAQDAVERRWLAEQAAMGSFHKDACGWAGDDEGDGDGDDDGFDDTTEDERALAGRNGDGAGPSAGAARRTARRGPRESRPPPPTSRVTGWSDPKSQMYAGIKQKIMTRILMEARRRDAAAEKAAAAETARVGEKRARDVPSRSRDVLRPETPSRGEHTRAFFSRYWSYAEWMVLWHVELLTIDARCFVSEPRRMSRRGVPVEADPEAAPGGERAPETVLSAVMDYVDGRVVRVVDARGAGGGLPGGERDKEKEKETQTQTGGGRDGASAGGARVTHRATRSEWPAPRAEGSEWRRLAAGVWGVGGFDVVVAVGAGAGAGDGDGDFRWGDGMRTGAGPSQQSHWCASPYYDARMFLFDGRAAAPDERQRPATEHPLRFAAAKRRVARVRARVAREERARTAAAAVGEGTVNARGNEDRGLSGSGFGAGPSPTFAGGDGDAFLASVGCGPGARSVRAARFKLPPAEAATRGHNHRQKRTITHVFHPVYPFAMSISQAFMQPQVVSFHVRWERNDGRADGRGLGVARRSRDGGGSSCLSSERCSRGFVRRLIPRRRARARACPSPRPLRPRRPPADPALAPALGPRPRRPARRISSLEAVDVRQPQDRPHQHQLEFLTGAVSRAFEPVREPSRHLDVGAEDRAGGDGDPQMAPSRGARAASANVGEARRT